MNSREKSTQSYGWYFNGIEEKQFKIGCQPPGFKRGRKPRTWTKQEIDKMIENQKKHFREKYGCDWATQADEVKSKKENTLLEKHGVKCILNLPEVKKSAHSKKARDKRVSTYTQTMNEKYGVDNYYQTEEFKTHSKEVKLKRYGNPYYCNQEKADATRLKRYGVKCAFNSSDVKINGKQGLLDKYGVTSYSKTREWSSKRRVKYEYDGYSFDSFWELAFYVWAKDHNKDIERCSVSFSYTYNSIDHVYHPDFVFEGNIIEIKGDHFFKSRGDISSEMICPYNRDLDGVFEAKHQCMLQNGVKILVSKDIEEALNYFNSVYKIEKVENLNIVKRR